MVTVGCLPWEGLPAALVLLWTDRGLLVPGVSEVTCKPPCSLPWTVLALSAPSCPSPASPSIPATLPCSALLPPPRSLPGFSH